MPQVTLFLAFADMALINASLFRFDPTFQVPIDPSGAVWQIALREDWSPIHPLLNRTSVPFMATA
jgi:hypothetical protein